MARGTGRESHRSAAPRRSRSRAAELDRISARLERMPAQRKALIRATKQFGSSFGYDHWERAFESADPDEINRVVQVTGDYMALVNHAIELVKAGAKLVGLEPTPGIQGAPGFVDAVRRDGGFSSAQANTFAELYRTRNRLQHSSPDVDADEVHRQVRVLIRHLPALISSYMQWLDGRGIRLE